MDKFLQDKIHAIATDVRFWTEGKAAFANYNPNDLMGWCAIASAELFRRLKNAGVDAEIHMSTEWNAHVFLIVEDHVIDVTATQFGHFRDTPIVIMHHRIADEHDFYQTSYTFESPKDLRTFQLKQRWPKAQVAYA